MNKEIDIKEINELIEKESAFIDMLLLEVNKVIIGQKHMMEILLIGLLGCTKSIRRCTWTCKNIGNKFFKQSS